MKKKPKIGGRKKGAIGGLTKRQKAAVDAAVLDGLGPTDAARKAGYAEETAQSAKAKIFDKPSVQAYFREIAAKAAPPQKLVDKLAEHVEGKYETTLVRRLTDAHGRVKTVVEKSTVVSPATSLEAIKTAAEFAGYVPRKGPAIAILAPDIESMTLIEIDAEIAKLDIEIAQLSRGKPIEPTVA